MIISRARSTPTTTPRPPAPRSPPRPAPRPQRLALRPRRLSRPVGRRGPAAGAQAQYPTSLMGVVAHLRQAMLDAENHHERLAYYERAGGPRPANDPALDALYSARTKALPVWWEANTRDEIHRALDLAEEFGTDAVIVGGREAGKVVSGSGPRTSPSSSASTSPRSRRSRPRPNIAARRPRSSDDRSRSWPSGPSSWKERVAVAKTLAAANVRFAFAAEGAGNSAANFHAQLRKVIAAGLSQGRAALDALTRRAAEIAGQGKQARHDREGQARPPRRHDRPAG